MSTTSSAGTQVVVGENVGSLWGKNQHFPHIIPTYSQQMINILPTTTFDQLWPNKLSHNCPCLNKFTSSYPQLNQHFVNGPITYQLTPFSCQFLKYGECWENVEVGRMLMSLVCLKPNMTLSIEWGECWVNVEVGRMLRRCWCHSSALNQCVLGKVIYRVIQPRWNISHPPYIWTRTAALTLEIETKNCSYSLACRTAHLPKTGCLIGWTVGTIFSLNLMCQGNFSHRLLYYLF